MRVIDDCWLTPAVVSLARAIHADRDWAALPVLADLLEDGGCPGEVACTTCGGHGYFYKGGDDYNTCREEQEQFRTGKVYCNGSGRIPNPLLAHLRSGGPHALGCHALEAILGGTTP